ELRDPLVLERLALHDVAPVAGRIADREENWPVVLVRERQGLLAPRVPVDGVVLVLEEVRRALARKPVGHGLRGYSDPGAPPGGGSDPSGSDPSQLGPLDLPARRLRECLGEVDDPRVLVRRGLATDVFF